MKIRVQLLGMLPAWVRDSHDGVGVDVQAEGSKGRTYGLGFLMEGIHRAYSKDGSIIAEMEVDLQK